MKYNWNVSDEDRQRILNLHESATKRHYLNEDETDVDLFKRISPADIDLGWKIYEKSREYPRETISWVNGQSNKKLISLYDDLSKKSTNVDSSVVGRIGRFVNKSPNLLSSFREFIKKYPKL